MVLTLAPHRICQSRAWSALWGCDWGNPERQIKSAFTGDGCKCSRNTDHTLIIKHGDIRLINVHCRYTSTAVRRCYLNLTNRALKCPWTWDKFGQSKSLYTPHSKILKDCMSPLNCSNLCSGYFEANNRGCIVSNVRVNIARFAVTAVVTVPFKARPQEHSV